ncbi:MAG: hypothetical protein JOY86_07820 [Candidatus Eremiobacteraeota bacterium]|nr:hypothetical protein [Candidatus Eremiobacteraeota bacterium]
MIWFVVVILVAVIVIALVVVTAVIIFGTSGQGLTPGPAPKNVYVSNQTANNVTIYAVVSGGEIATSPTATVSGRGMDSPIDVDVDPANRIYVLNRSVLAGPSISWFDGDTSSGYHVSGTIIGDQTKLDTPEGLAWFSRTGGVLISSHDPGGSAIFEFPVTSGNTAPDGSFNSPGFRVPWKICVDESLRVYIADPEASTIFAFQYAGQWNAQPLFAIVGPHTQLVRPVSVAVDSNGIVYVLNAGLAYDYPPSITGYSPGGASGQVDLAPNWIIGGPGSKFTGGQKLTVDTSGNLYLLQNDTIVVFTAGAPPQRTQVVGGPNAGLSGASGIAVI